MDRMSIDREGGVRAASARAVIGTAFVMGLAALVWAHVDLETGTAPILERAFTPGVPAVAVAKAPAPACASADCLPAPAGHPSVPVASSLFPDASTSPLDVLPLPSY